jgi:hypothetical protein
MKIDLFSTTLYDLLKENFGIYDDDQLPTEPAKVVLIENGTAKVQNPNKNSVFFIPLDKNIECLRDDGTLESQCDALLISLRSQNKYGFYFVELKEVRTAGWIPDGVEQLKTTVNTFRSNYNLSCLSIKMAFLANKKFTFYHSNTSHKELMERFRNETGFRLSICAAISIK